MNYVKTTLLLGLLTGLFMLFGNLLGGQNGMLIGLVIAGGMNFFSYWFSDKIVLAMYGAKEADPNQFAGLYRIIRRLTEKAGMPMPKVYVIPEEQPNAFATGRSPKHAAVAATVGIMRILNEEELEGVMAHELMHVAHRDTLISTIAATFAGAISYAATIVKWGAIFGGGRDDDDRGNFAVAIAMAIVAPIAALLIQMAISRSREFAADEGAGELCGKPMSLANALRKLHRGAEMIPMGGSPAAASLFIVNPFAGGIASWFSTHPPMEKRIEKLELQQRTIA